MPKSEIQNEKDAVTLKAETSLESAKDQLEFKKKKLAEIEATAIRADHSIRGTQALEAAQRREEVLLLEKRIKECEKYLSQAVADQPRRDSQRKNATGKLAQAQELEAQAFKVSEALKKLQDQATDLREEARLSLEAANFTAQEIKNQEEADKAREVKARQELVSKKETNLRSAELSLMAAQESGHAEIIREREEIRDRRKKELAETLHELSTAGAV